MADPIRQAPQPVSPSTPAASSIPGTRTSSSCEAGDTMPCDRCGTGMFRMHAVWRCPNCGFKTDCCGW